MDSTFRSSSNQLEDREPMMEPTFNAMIDSFSERPPPATLMRGTRRRGRPPKHLGLSRASLQLRLLTNRSSLGKTTQPSTRPFGGSDGDNVCDAEQFPFPSPAARTSSSSAATRAATTRASNEHVSSKLGAASSASPSATSETRDAYCWTCHRDSGRLLSCAKCPRAFHSRCLQARLLEASSGWICPECEVRSHAPP